MTEHENLISVPPDGGWGWVILCVSFFGGLLIDMPAYCFQILEHHLRDLLGLSPAEVSLLFSTYNMCMFLMGPVACGMCNRFGFRLTNILGCLLMIIGFTASFFLKTFVGFLLLFGLMAGCGSSFILLVSNVAVGFWFESKRTIAFGIVTAASGGSVFTLILSSYVAEEYGWRFCFLQWAAMIFVLLVASFLLGPPPMVELESDMPLIDTVDISRITNIIPLDYNTRSRGRRLSAKKLRTMSMATGIPLGRSGRPSVVPQPEAVGFGRYFKCCTCCQQSIGSRPLYRKDIFYTGSMRYAAKKEKQDDAFFPLTMSKLPSTRDIAQEVECTCTIPEAFTRALKEMIDWSLLSAPVFLLILAASFLVYAVRFIPFLVLKKYNSPHMGMDAAANVVSLMGSGTLLARAAMGFVMYAFSNLSPLAATIFVTVAGGLAICSLTFSHNVLYQMIIGFSAGALTSLFLTVRSLLIIDLLGLSKLTSCTGLLYFFQGFASFLGLPVSEILTAKTGTFGASIVFSGCSYILAGVCNICIVIIKIGKRIRSQNI